MMVYMSSKEFQDEFLVNEDDQDILDAQYVLVSTRIRRRNAKIENIVVANNIIYPDASVSAALTKSDYRSAYFEMLDKCTAFLAVLIKGAIEKKYNIVFICSKNEMKLKYLKYLAEYIYMEFGYPVYNYSLYSSGACHLIKYNKEKILKKCNKILKDAENREYQMNKQTKSGRDRIISNYKDKKKKELKKILKDRDLYQEGMSKKEMIDTLSVFL